MVVGSGSDIGDAIVQHPTATMVSSTGSTDVGEGIAKKAALKRTALELGGNGPVVVLDDADLDQAVDASIFGSFFHQGQICMIANRLTVDAAGHDEFVERFVARAKSLVVGDPSDPSNWSRCTTSWAAPWARAPNCSAAVNRSAQRLANATPYGLSSAVFSDDVERAVRFARRIEAGMTHVNDSPVNDDANTAFGGEKVSGTGRFEGNWSVDEFTTEHWVSVQHRPREYAI